MNKLFHIICVISFFLFQCTVQAADQCQDQQKFEIQSIQVQGLTKTHPRVVLRELGFKQHDRVCTDQIVEGINRIKRIGLFSRVESNFSINSKTDLDELQVTVEEKWTTIPILKVASGGGVSQYTLGIYDPNVFGEYIEAGGQYENLEGTHSGVLWLKNPRLFDSPQGFDLQYWNTKRIRIKYDQNANEPLIKQSFLHEREKFYSDFFKELSNELTVRFSIEYNKDRFSKDFLPKTVLNAIGENAELPDSTTIFVSRFGADYGHVNGESYSLNGQVLTTHLSYGFDSDGKTDPFFQGDVSFVYFKVFASDWQFAQRLQAGATSTKVLQYWYYLGGLDRIRGFSDNRFSGRNFGLSNSEVRYLLKSHPSFYLQGVGFLDFAGIGETSAAFSEIKAASLGTGIRFILPKFYRFVVRLDYAKPIKKSDSMNWSLGVQQFY